MNDVISSALTNRPRTKEIDLSIVFEYEDFQCYNNSDGKPVFTNIDDELQRLPKETKLTLETGINTEQLPHEPYQAVRKSKRLCKTNRKYRRCT